MCNLSQSLVCYPDPVGDSVRRARWKAFVERVTAVPALTDPADAISASLVARTIDLLLVATALFAVAAALAGTFDPVYALTLPAGLVLLALLRWILSRGHVRGVAYAVCTLGWLFTSADLQLHGPDTVAVGGFVVVIVLAGLTLGAQGAAALTVATAALISPFLLGVVEGRFVAPTGRDRVIHYTTQLALAGTLAAWWAMRTRRLLAELRRSEARRTLLLEGSPDAIVSTDALGGMTFQNRAAEQMFGYPPGEVVGRPWPEFLSMHGADADRLHGQFKATVDDGVGLPLGELTVRHREGHEVVVEAKGMPLWEDRRIVGVVAILRDVSARKRAEAERASLQRQLVQAQRMEAVGRVAGGVAHDFNNLLTIILAAAATGDRAAMGDIREAAQRGVALTRQLLALGRRKAPDPRPTDVNQSITAVRPMLRRVLGADVTLAVDLAPRIPTVVVDAGHLDQVLLNLAANARDAMPKGGTLTLATASLDGRVALHVTDTGTGMDAATLASAFEPFFTTKGERGTGLGLAVVQNIVKEAGGTINCASEPGRGTSFAIHFPASPEAATHPAGPTRAPSRIRLQRVVFVDDNELLRNAMARALEQAGFVVDVFDGGHDVSAIEARLAGAEALITDLVMPGKSGLDLAVELRRRNVRVPILFISGYAEHTLLKQVREVPRSALLEKPFSVEDVAERLADLQSG